VERKTVVQSFRKARRFRMFVQKLEVLSYARTKSFSNDSVRVCGYEY
ncbi:uncharacterized protein METZ01_LOCUS416715, partial [marine metagenome]